MDIASSSSAYEKVKELRHGSAGSDGAAPLKKADRRYECGEVDEYRPLAQKQLFSFPRKPTTTGSRNTRLLKMHLKDREKLNPLIEEYGGKSNAEKNPTRSSQLRAESDR
jgi:hypothetical protein